MPELFDVIEIIIDLPKENVRAGMHGAIVEKFSELAYLIEFANEHGETLEIVSLTTDQFIVVWRNATRNWVPMTEQAAALISHLSNEAAHEVLDFARFLAIRNQQNAGQSNPRDMVEQLVTA